MIVGERCLCSKKDIYIDTVEKWNSFFTVKTKATNINVTHDSNHGFEAYKNRHEVHNKTVKHLDGFECEVTALAYTQAGSEYEAMIKVFFKDGSTHRLVYVVDGDDRYKKIDLVANEEYIYRNRTDSIFGYKISFTLSADLQKKEIEKIEFSGSMNGIATQKDHVYLDKLMFKGARQ